MEPDPEKHEDLDELTPAIRDVAYRLTHDLSDTREDIGDALAFAPVALVKLLDRFVAYAAARPKRAIAMFAGLLLAGAVVVTQRRRRQTEGPAAAARPPSGK